MTTVRRMIWLLASLASTLFLFGIAFAAFSLGRGDWTEFFRSPARIGAVLVSLILSGLVVFSGFGGMNAGKKEDKATRRIFLPFIVVSLAWAVLPAYLDGRNLWTTDETVTPYVGLALLTLGGALRLAAVFVLGKRFTALVAIQEGHRLATDGLYKRIRHPSYTGLLMYMAGYVLVFRCWPGMLFVAVMLELLIGRMNAEETLLESEFGEEYVSYRRRTWRLAPWVY
jgi:protein-S-isoprenylcysteine O-methyltransferase Ste14